MSNHYDTTSYDTLPGEELTHNIRLFKAMMDEMKAWDTEDAEDAASGRFPLPAQPYCESPHFETLMQEIQKIRTVLRQRTNSECNVVDIVDDEISENLVDSLTQPISHLNLDNNTWPLTTSPPDILAPPPLPLSPNINTYPSRSQSHILHPAQNRHPPDILTPQPLPLKPNIPVTAPPSTLVSDVRG